MTDDNDVHVTAEAREHQDGFGKRENREVADHGGIVRDEQISRAMSIRSIHYDPTEADRPGAMPGQVQNLEKHEQIRMVEGTETFRKAMENGDIPSIKHIVGDTSKRADVSGIKAIGKIDELINGPAPVVVVLGEMGAGKTDFAGLLGQRWRALQGGESLVGSNIRSLQERDRWVDERGEVNDGWIPDYPTMMDWVKQDGNPLEHSQRPKLFIGDEFSSAASGTGAQGHETRKKMGPLVFKIRKYGGALIYIGHDESSIHPMLWRVGKVVKKVSQKKAIIADGVKNGQLTGIEGEIEGIPPTDWRFNTAEASDWSWSRSSDDGEPEMEEESVKMVSMWTMVNCREQGMSARETAEYVPYSHATVSNWLEEYDSGGEKADWVNNVEAAIA
ncbi:hypothetical protein [Natrinema halophilum]|uniref:Uncharacterized protein n=1 Tax=Natrinema halophilum TaxID=1699371 RepID=A0A7D5GK97_9EURY|nr:hypothetical protein [Natrinema halophilum]QLG51087.1 hypothetical protein HYG82_20755 [Natrinema halophilum]